MWNVGKVIMRTYSFLFTSQSTYTTSAAEIMHHRLKVEFGVGFFFPFLNFFFIFALLLLRQIPICLGKILSAVTLLWVAIYSYQHLAHTLASVLWICDLFFCLSALSPHINGKQKHPITLFSVWKNYNLASVLIIWSKSVSLKKIHV